MNETQKQLMRERFSQTAQDIERRYGMVGLSGGLYEDYAWDIFQEVFEQEITSALAKRDENSNNTFIGHYAGYDLHEGSDIVIIGDNIRSLNPEENKDTLFLGKKVAIGNYLFGEYIGLKDIIEKFINKNK